MFYSVHDRQSAKEIHTNNKPKNSREKVYVAYKCIFPVLQYIFAKHITFKIIFLF